MKKIMFDTNVFDKLPEMIETLQRGKDHYKYYVTSVQIEEICNIPDLNKERRIVNMLMLSEIRAELVPVSVLIFGYSRFGFASFGEGKVYEEILSPNHSNIRDAMIVDTAVHEGCTLITEDKDLYKKMTRNGYNAMLLSEFMIASRLL